MRMDTGQRLLKTLPFERIAHLAISEEKRPFCVFEPPFGRLRGNIR